MEAIELATFTITSPVKVNNTLNGEHCSQDHICNQHGMICAVLNNSIKYLYQAIIMK